MAIKIDSTTVINNSRGLENITNLKTVAGQSILGSGDIATGSTALGGTGQTTYTNGQLLIGNTTGSTLTKSTLTQGTGISISNGAGSITITNSAPDQTVSLTQGGATTITGTYPNFTISSTNTTYGTATSTTPGLVELFSDTAQSVAANAVTTTASRTYGIQVNAAGQMVVNVPWTSSGTGTVTSVSGTGSVGGLTLSGTVTTSGNLTLGGSLTVATSSVAGIVSTGLQSFSGSKTLLGQGHGIGAVNPSSLWNLYAKGSGGHPSVVAEGSGTTGATCFVAIKNSNANYCSFYNGTSAAVGQMTVSIADAGAQGGSVNLYNSTGTNYAKISQNSGYILVDGTLGVASAVNNVTEHVLTATEFRPQVDIGLTLGTSGARWGQIYSSSSTISTSDSRTKYDIEDLKIGLDFIEALQPSEYKVLTSAVKTVPLNTASQEEIAAGTITQDSITGEEIVKINIQGNRVHSGFIAQQVKQALGSNDYAIWCLDDSSDPNSRQSLRYEELISPMVKAIQELSAKVRELEASLALLSKD